MDFCRRPCARLTCNLSSQDMPDNSIPVNQPPTKGVRSLWGELPPWAIQKGVSDDA